MDEKISVVITTYKRPINILARAVNSVLNQTYPNLELFVINDAPQERELAEEIGAFLEKLDDPRIKYVIQDKNMGANAARNLGLREASGKYIAYLDDDDEWEETKLARQIKCMDENTAMVYGSFIIRSKSGEYLMETPVYTEPLSAILEDNYIGSTSFPLLRTDYVRACGGFDESVPRCQELELWIRLISKYKIKYIEGPLGFYYMSEDSIYRSHPEKYIAAIEIILKKNKDLYSANKRVHSNRLMNAARDVMGMRKWGYALWYKMRAIAVDIRNPNVWKTWVGLDFVYRGIKYGIKKFKKITRKT